MEKPYLNKEKCGPFYFLMMSQHQEMCVGINYATTTSCFESKAQPKKLIKNSDVFSCVREKKDVYYVIVRTKNTH